MNDEIKEILDKLKETVDYPKLNYSSYDKSYNETIDNVAMIKSFACKQLLEYITNLQKENKKQKEVIDKINHILNNQINYREFVDIVNAIEDVIKKVDK